MRPFAPDLGVGSGSPSWGAGAQTHLQRPEKTENASPPSEAGGQGAGAGRGPRGQVWQSQGSVRRREAAVCVRLAGWQPLVVQRARSKLQNLFLNNFHPTILTRDIAPVNALQALGAGFGIW